MNPEREVFSNWGWRLENGNRLWAITFSISMLCHIGLFAGLLAFQGYHPPHSRSPSIITVAMVSLPGDLQEKPPAAVSTPQTPPAQVSTAQPESAQSPPAPEISVASKPKPKISLKKKTFKREKVLKSAIENIEKQVDKTKPDPLKRALDKLKEKVQTQPSQMPPSDKVGRERIGSGVPAGGSLKGQKVLELIDIYRVEIAFEVQKHWAFPQQLAGNQSDLMVELAFTVLPNGEIKDIWFDRRSGNRFLDESARKAVLKASPVERHPEGLNKPYITVGLRFTPEGIR